jgi:hypothetical protein
MMIRLLVAAFAIAQGVIIHDCTCLPCTGEPTQPVSSDTPC